ncbi:GMC oxidoreductase [Pleomassaria siparia CBS 279.74]|uniref:GMC oxidoreductase n=1 Tax=Pleomassaria siparia CBS 279.74 TaxID=1314801 RepID=A0A6G1KKQ3_9PLEO|nr:GMC oxidoreductase [Pleomassaria siparia CBS 279.74]
MLHIPASKALAQAQIYSQTLLRQFYAPGRLTGNSFGNTSVNETYDYFIVGAGLARSLTVSRIAEVLPNMTVAVVEVGSFYEIYNGNYNLYHSTKYVGPDPDDWQPLLDTCATRDTKGLYEAIANITGDDALSFTPLDATYRVANATANFTLSTLDILGGLVHLSLLKYAQPISSYAAEAYAAAGFNAPDGFLNGKLLGYGHWPFTLRVEDSTRSITEVAFLSLTSARTSLTIYQSCLARNLLFDENKRATGINITAAGLKPFNLSARREVIVSSGVRYNIAVVSDLSGVGQNLRDTPNLGDIVYESSVSSSDVFENDAVERYLTNGSGPLSSPAGDFGGWEKFPASYIANLSQSTRNFLHSHSMDTGSIGMLTTSTASTDNVTIQSADNAVAPLLYIGGLDPVEDQEIGVAAVERARSIVRGIRAFGAEMSPGANITTDAQILNWIKLKGLTAIHHGADGTKVIDTNSLPFSAPGHAQGVTYAHAEKLVQDVINAAQNS